MLLLLLLLLLPPAPRVARHFVQSFDLFPVAPSWDGDSTGRGFLHNARTTLAGGFLTNASSSPFFIVITITNNNRAAKEASQLKGMRKKFVETWYNQSNIIVINAPRLIGLPGHGLFRLRGPLFCDNGRVSKHASGGATAAAAVQIDWGGSGSQPQADGLPRGNRLETGVKASR
ncbi:hypothetical protein IWZ03DRAFT_361794 [Phyllosticta citriasiana]|uniref:Uncharacterized protein n=1 Tax=Phyllosticta citriasiana TaxID=595635 RepID=A0ABR1KIC7_9PEZI